MISGMSRSRSKSRSRSIGRRFAILACKIAQVDTNRRAGDLTEEEINKISDIFAKPTGK